MLNYILEPKTKVVLAAKVHMGRLPVSIPLHLFSLQLVFRAAMAYSHHQITPLRMLLKLCGILLLPVLFAGSACAQPYLSLSEPVPYACPVTCAGGTINVVIYQIQRLPAGSEVQAELSNASGVYGTGSQIMPIAAYSNSSSGPFTTGPYRFTADVSNLYARFVIPAATPAGSGYTMRIRASTGFHSSDNFRCPSSSGITVLSSSPALAQVPQNTEGQNQWKGHIYRWIPTSSSPINTPALVGAQNFFDSVNYQGHAVYDSLSLDLPFDATGGIPGTTANGSTFGCAGNSLSTNFTTRLKRRQNFTAGRYNLSIQGDDGIRLSTDGGATWLLSNWIDQQYQDSYLSTVTAYPNGICFSGPVDLVVEYFQHSDKARLTFKATPVTTNPITPPQNQSVCEGAASVTFQGGSSDPGVTYQWQLSTDGGATFSDLANAGPYSGVATAQLLISNPLPGMDGYKYRLQVTGTCLSRSAVATLTVASNPVITQQPISQPGCSGTPVQFRVIATGHPACKWQYDDGTGFKDFTVPQTDSVLTVPAASQSTGTRYRAILTGRDACSSAVLYSDVVSVLPGSLPSISLQPQNTSGCVGFGVSFEVSSNGNANYKWQFDDGTGFKDFTIPKTGTLLTVVVDPFKIHYLYRAVITGGGSCSTATVYSDTVKVVAVPLPQIIRQPHYRDLCDGVPTSFSLNATSAHNYKWVVNKGQGIIDITDPGIEGIFTDSLTVLSPNASMMSWRFYCLVYSDPICGGGYIPSFDIGFYQAVQVQMDKQPESQTLCTDSVVFSASVSRTGYAYKWQYSADGISTWTDLKDGAGYSGTGTGNLTVSKMPSGVGSSAFYRVYVPLTCKNDSLISHIAELKPCCMADKPNNVVTGYGKNNRFGVYSCTFQQFKLQIFNRWGILVFSTDQASDGWDGGDLPSGTYYYVIDYSIRDQTNSYTGFVQLIK